LIAPTLSAASAVKAPETMASKSSPPEREPVSFEAFGQDILRRRAAAGDPVVPRNAGKHRTASKRALHMATLGQAQGGRAGGSGDAYLSLH
jgi:hypothetical protein